MGFDFAFTPDLFVQKLPRHAEVFLVGGAVRDRLMGLEGVDQDWVVVGATAQDMLNAGFKPVGADFPVFLHPNTSEEYALARTERKSGHGYKGFTFYSSPDVTLEEDLKRRDFTINAMAVNSRGELIDPYGGQVDIGSKVFRHVSSAFAEDPLRVLRLARFLARFTDFGVAKQTRRLCAELVNQGEMGHLTAERSFAELDRVMHSVQPSRAWRFLADLGVWATLASSAPSNWRNLTDDAAGCLDGLKEYWMRWAWWLSRVSSQEALVGLCRQLKVTKQHQAYALVWLNIDQAIAEPERYSTDLQPWAELLSKVDLYRKPDRFMQIVHSLSQTSLKGTQRSILEHLMICGQLVLDGVFKEELRQHLVTFPSGKRAEQAQGFKLMWLERNLNF